VGPSAVGPSAVGPSAVGPSAVGPSAVGPSAVVGALATAAPGLAHAWLEHARLPTDGSPVLLVDRRSVSLETKWRLENEPLVQLRQAIITSVTPRANGTVLIETAFGEELEAEVVVLAVGLALGGRTTVGAQESPGGRYGEVAADALLESLTAQGVTLRKREAAVGARLGRRTGAQALGALSTAGRVMPLARCDAEVPALPHGGHRLPADHPVLPPSPYEEACGGGSNDALVSGAEPDGILGPRDLWLAPDGITTGEWYLDPELDEVIARAIMSANGWWSAEPPHSVSGHIVVGDGGPREILDGVWVVGQVAGAGSYMESLGSGWRLGCELGRLRRSLGGRS